MLILSVCLCSCQDNSANLGSEDSQTIEAFEDEAYSSETEQNIGDAKKDEDSMLSSIEQNLYASSQNGSVLTLVSSLLMEM